MPTSLRLTCAYPGYFLGINLKHIGRTAFGIASGKIHVAVLFKSPGLRGNKTVMLKPFALLAATLPSVALAQIVELPPPPKPSFAEFAALFFWYFPTPYFFPTVFVMGACILGAAVWLNRRR